MPTFPPWGVRMVHCDRKTKIDGLSFKVGPDRCDDNANENSRTVRVRMGGRRDVQLIRYLERQKRHLGSDAGERTQLVHRLENVGVESVV